MTDVYDCCIAVALESKWWQRRRSMIFQGTCEFIVDSYSLWLVLLVNWLIFRKARWFRAYKEHSFTSIKVAPLLLINILLQSTCVNASIAKKCRYIVIYSGVLFFIWVYFRCFLVHSCTALVSIFLIEVRDVYCVFSLFYMALSLQTRNSWILFVHIWHVGAVHEMRGVGTLYLSWRLHL